MRYFASILLIMCSYQTVSAENRLLFDSLQYRVEMQATLSSGDHTPLWLNANKYGLSSLKTSNGYLRGALQRPLSLDDGRKWGIGYGADLAVAAGFTSTLVVQQAYVEGRWLKGVLTVGAKEQPMELKNQELSTGSQTLGINARPVPQVRLALPDYWAIPGTRKWLSLKGHIAYGMYTDDNWQKDFTSEKHRYTEHALYHSKAGYLKIGKEGKPFSAELGVELACQFGGTSYMKDDNGDKIYHNDSGLKAFLHALIPGGGEVNETTYQNSEGNHLGSWLLRLNYNLNDWCVSLYADKFFEDQSAMFMLDYDGYGTGDEWNEKKDNRYLLYDFKDIMLGAELQLRKVTWLQNIVIEYLYAKYQSGSVYHDRTPSFPDHIGGIDENYNHYILMGWEHWGQVAGNPLYLSPLYNDDGRIEVKNNRFKAWHLGISGQPLPSLHYRILASWQDGLGRYKSPYTHCKYNTSLLAEVGWTFAKGWKATAAWGADFGAIRGDNNGIQLTLSKTGIISTRR